MTKYRFMVEGSKIQFSMRSKNLEKAKKEARKESPNTSRDSYMVSIYSDADFFHRPIFSFDKKLN